MLYHCGNRMDCGEHLLTGVGSLWLMSVHLDIVIAVGDLMATLKILVAFLSMATLWLYVTTHEKVWIVSFCAPVFINGFLKDYYVESVRKVLV